MPPDRERIEADVAIIGAGAAGIAAGLEARSSGARVLVVDMAAEPGGTAIMSGGGCMLVQTPLQDQLAIIDSPDAAFRDWMAWGGRTADAEWARYYIDHSARDVYEWAEQLGVEWDELVLHEGNSVPRWTRPRLGGLGMMRALIATYRERAGCLQMAMTVRRLVMAEGRVVGFVGDLDGHSVEVAARSIVVATGGFASNMDLVLRHRPDLDAGDVSVGSGPGALGLGHGFVSDAGGAQTNLDKIWFYPYGMPDPRLDAPDHGVAFRNVPDNIWVDASGSRFHNEDLTGGKTGAVAVLRQRPRPCWAIIDGTMADGLELADPRYQWEGRPDRLAVTRFLEQSPHVMSAPTIEELATLMNVRQEVLAKTVAGYNRAVSQEAPIDEAFGRDLTKRRPIAEPPFWGLELRPLARKTLGGVRTDLRCRVLDGQGRPIDGLFAAGEVAGMAGGRINGSAALEGTMLGPSLFSGRVAGAWAAKRAGRGRGFEGGPSCPGQSLDRTAPRSSSTRFQAER